MNYVELHTDTSSVLINCCNVHPNRMIYHTVMVTILVNLFDSNPD